MTASSDYIYVIRLIRFGLRLTRPFGRCPRITPSRSTTWQPAARHGQSFAKCPQLRAFGGMPGPIPCLSHARLRDASRPKVASLRQAVRHTFEPM